MWHRLEIQYRRNPLFKQVREENPANELEIGKKIAVTLYGIMNKEVRKPLREDVLSDEIERLLKIMFKKSLLYWTTKFPKVLLGCGAGDELGKGYQVGFGLMSKRIKSGDSRVEDSFMSYNWQREQIKESGGIQVQESSLNAECK